jgi:hypothetical protein
MALTIGNGFAIANWNYGHSGIAFSGMYLCRHACTGCLFLKLRGGLNGQRTGLKDYKHLLIG